MSLSLGGGFSYYDHNGDLVALRSSWKRTSAIMLHEEVVLNDLYSTVPSQGLTLIDDSPTGFRVMSWNTTASPQEWKHLVLFRGKSFGNGPKSLECLQQEACVQKTQGNITKKDTFIWFTPNYASARQYGYVCAFHVSDPFHLRLLLINDPINLAALGRWFAVTGTTHGTTDARPSGNEDDEEASGGEDDEDDKESKVDYDHYVSNLTCFNVRFVLRHETWSGRTRLQELCESLGVDGWVYQDALDINDQEWCFYNQDDVTRDKVQCMGTVPTVFNTQEISHIQAYHQISTNKYGRAAIATTMTQSVNISQGRVGNTPG